MLNVKIKILNKDESSDFRTIVLSRRQFLNQKHDIAQYIEEINPRSPTGLFTNTK